ncbi:hypothetical protein BC938DRAFT_473284 [Jimgerdemannia flammicorona]|uniref:Uncharacterized protein n=1 Tax=Jimgerdemannia flammicorona TaxID=994334 RepID=A0A433Q4H2_9FUNG|nr:hypothetical protein BC938DRAFT_473284 [Jimgerdemannia flammicorona]
MSVPSWKLFSSSVPAEFGGDDSACDEVVGLTGSHTRTLNRVGPWLSRAWCMAMISCACDAFLKMARKTPRARGGAPTPGGMCLVRQLGNWTSASTSPSAKSNPVPAVPIVPVPAAVTAAAPVAAAPVAAAPVAAAPGIAPPSFFLPVACDEDAARCRF